MGGRLLEPFDLDYPEGRPEPPGPEVVGVGFGAPYGASAVSIVERTPPDAPHEGARFRVRSVEMFPAKTKYGDIARRAGEVVEGLKRPPDTVPLVLDAALGVAVSGLFRSLAGRPKLQPMLVTPRPGPGIVHDEETRMVATGDLASLVLVLLERDAIVADRSDQAGAVLAEALGVFAGRAGERGQARAPGMYPEDHLGYLVRAIMLPIAFEFERGPQETGPRPATPPPEDSPSPWQRPRTV
jgi:hypothetical protein